MTTSFCLIYFIHDDPGLVFKLNVIPTILDTPYQENIKIILIHNRREEVRKGEQKFISYNTTVQEVIKGGNGKSEFLLIGEEQTWQMGFGIAFTHLKKFANSGRFVKLGLITLSHSNGFVINRNGENVAAGISSADDSKNPDLSSIIANVDDENIFVNALTVLEEAYVQNDDNKILYKQAYIREADDGQFFCKNYEGLFVSEFAKVLKVLLADFNKSINVPEETKLCFFISGNCNFQLYDNLFLFAPLANFLMAAQFLNSIRFWHFPTIIQAINMKMENDNQDLCRFIFDLCAANFAAKTPSDHRHYFLTSTHNFSELNLKFEMIVEGIRQCVQTNHVFSEELLKKLLLLTETSGFITIPFFDVAEIFDLAVAIQPDEFGPAVIKFKKLLCDAIVTTYINGRSLCGFSLYFPRDKTEFNAHRGPQCNYFLNKEANPFALNSAFDNILLALFK